MSSLQLSTSAKKHAVVKLIPRGAHECVPREFLLIEDDNDKLRHRLFEAKQHSRYPTACDAQVALRELQRARCRVFMARMEIEETNLLQRERENKKMLDMIKTIGSGKVDSHWTERDLKYIAKTHARHKQARETEVLKLKYKVCQTQRQDESYLVSRYSRETLEQDWRHTVKDIYQKSLFPCSDWWHEYLENVAGDNPQRIPPPRPRICCGHRLESLEERECSKIDSNLFSLNHEQLQREQQQKKLELDKAESHHHQLQEQALVADVKRSRLTPA